MRKVNMLIVLFMYLTLGAINMYAADGITLNKTSLELYKRRSETLIATVTGAEVVQSWISSDPAVAMVDANGKVTAVKEGNATITVNGKTTSASCEVTVKIPIKETITISPTELTLEVGQTAVIKGWTADPAVPIEWWHSTNTTVATVDENTGEVTALSPGEAEITGSVGGHFKSCKLTVVPVSQPPVVAVAGVSLDRATLTLKEGESSTLTETVLPANAADKSVTWNSSSPAVATVNTSGTINALKAGNTIITVKTNDGGYTATCNLTVEKKEEPITTVTVKVSASPAAGGSVSGDGNYTSGSEVTIKATPNENYLFKQWETNGVAVSTDAAYSFKVNADTELTAVFEEDNTTSAATIATETKISACEGLLSIQSENALGLVTVHRVNGQCLYKNTTNGHALQITDLPKELLIVTVGTHTTKIMMQ